ncbi:MAG: hypothetical protein HYS73_00615 [Parcubacteria group bacterium]|nr:hypothetical protein [Parcubacteria group bacterium]MBI2048954.1 hypothetical protein [Parcubacteria group bacterium]
MTLPTRAQKRGPFAVGGEDIIGATGVGGMRGGSIFVVGGGGDDGGETGGFAGLSGGSGLIMGGTSRVVGCGVCGKESCGGMFFCYG